MKNFSGLTPEERARLLDLEKSVELDKAKPIIKKDFLSFVKYANQSYDDAFTKLVALETLKDNDEKVYYIVNVKHLWTKTSDVKVDNEIKKPDQETDQEELPF